MKVAVFTPTYRPGGLDVLEASLMRQNFRNFFWVVADERYHDRKHAWEAIESRVDFNIYFLKQYKNPEKKRNLCSSYNRAVNMAEMIADVTAFVSLQDYMYIEEDGLQRFAEFCSEHPNDLVTGVTHISRDPYPNKVVDLEGGYTIFSGPYKDKPRRMSWEDVRVTEMYRRDEDIFPVEIGHWEANWAAVPGEILRRGIRWNPDYDYGIAYENMDFAQRCHRDYGSKVYLDKKNVAISLPHKDYFEGEREEIEQFSNRERYEQDWH